MLTNPAPPPREVEPERAARGTFVFVGRLTRQKDLGTAIDGGRARARTRGSSSSATGPSAASSSAAAAALDGGGRIEFLGALSRDEALAVVAGAEAGPALERLGEPAALGRGGALGRRAGRRDGRRRRARGRPRRRERPARAARPVRSSSRPRSAACSRNPGCASGWPPRREAVGRGASRARRLRQARGAARRGGAMSERPPRPLRRRGCATRLPLPGWLAKKWDAIEPELDYRVLGAARGGQRAERRALPARAAAAPAPARRRALLSSAALPRAARAAGVPARRRSSRRTRSSAPPPRSAGGSPGRRTPVIVEVHGDWRTFTRLYGSPARRLLGPLADRVAASAVRHADATRAVSTFTSAARRARARRARRAPSSRAFSDLSAFAERPPEPLPERPTVIFVAALERYKNIDGLAAAWRLARRPRAGREARDRRPRLAARASSSGSCATCRTASTHHDWLEPDEVAAALDDATAARAALVARRARPRRHRGVRARPRRRRDRGGRHSRPRRRTASRGCSSRRPTWPRSRRRSSACSPTASSRRGSAPRRGERYADWHSTPGAARGRAARARRPRRRTAR